MNEQYEMYGRCYVCCKSHGCVAGLLVRCGDCRSTELNQPIIAAYPIYPDTEWERNAG